MRNTKILLMPPPICPPPPKRLADVCTMNCTSDGLKVQKTNPCRCECVRAIPAECPTPIPREHGTKHQHKNRKGRRTHTPTSNDGCRELTPKGYHYKKKKRVSRRPHSHSHHTHAHTKTPTQITSTNLCPSGQQLNNSTCHCMRITG